MPPLLEKSCPACPQIMSYTVRVAATAPTVGEKWSRECKLFLDDVVYFLMSVAELHVVPGHAVVFIVVLAIALSRIESIYPRHWHAVDVVERLSWQARPIPDFLARQSLL